MSYTRQVERTMRWQAARAIRKGGVVRERQAARMTGKPQLSAGLRVSEWFKLIKGGRREQEG